VSERSPVTIRRLVALGALFCLGLLAAATQAESRRAADLGTRLLAREPDLGATAVASSSAKRPLRIPYRGGPVLHSTRVHLIFWQPAGSGLAFDPDYAPIVAQFVQDVAAMSHMTTNVFALTGQYRDARGPAAYAVRYAGSLLVSDPLPSSECTEPASTGPGWSVCLTAVQIQQELEHVIEAEHLPNGPPNVYVLLTPAGLGDCQDTASSSCALGGSRTGYCGYHSWTTAGIIYAVVPFNAVAGHCESGNPRPNSSSADPALSTIAHELVETVTDPYGNAWITSSGDEIADVCLSAFGGAVGGQGAVSWNQTINGHHYWLQEVYGRLQRRCESRPRPDRVAIVGPRQLAAGVRTTFTARARQPGGAVKSYRWSFGAGRTAYRRSVSRVYARGGRYRIMLRITDSADNWAFAGANVSVTPRPQAAAPARKHRARTRVARSRDSG